jgi:CubicO group peptidase (beta-lactamase class C family)
MRYIASRLVIALVALIAASAAAADYFPPRGTWERKAPAELGIDAAKLKAAIDYAVANENPASKDVADDLKNTFGKREPNYRIIGPTQARAALNGIVVHRGYVVAEWGDTVRADMAHSVTKTFLTTVVGLAWQRGLIRDLNDRASSYLPSAERAELFGSEHNAPITWDHLLRQTRGLVGHAVGIPDWGRPSRRRYAGRLSNRPMREPGTYFKYNDVRVNLLALCALHVWRRPLPQVLREEVMDPIGASNTWRWYGYETSWVELDGQRVQSVSGGGHFGGGMFISAWDMARFGYLFLRGGTWIGREIVSERWIALARTPGPANPNYGFANWYLNTGRKPLPNAPASAVRFVGNGANIVYIDWENDLVVVVRWIKDDAALNEFLGRVIGALSSPK